MEQITLAAAVGKQLTGFVRYGSQVVLKFGDDDTFAVVTPINESLTEDVPFNVSDQQLVELGLLTEAQKTAREEKRNRDRDQANEAAEKALLVKLKAKWEPGGSGGNSGGGGKGR